MIQQTISSISVVGPYLIPRSLFLLCCEILMWVGMRLRIRIRIRIGMKLEIEPKPELELILIAVLYSPVYYPKSIRLLWVDSRFKSKRIQSNPIHSNLIQYGTILHKVESGMDRGMCVYAYVPYVMCHLPLSICINSEETVSSEQ